MIRFNSNLGPRELSNFYPAPFALVLRCGTFTFPNAEAAFQCLKQQPLTAEKITPFLTLSGKEARARGRYRVLLRPDWPQVKVEAMRWVLTAKFAQPTLRDCLLRTEDAQLVHEAAWDDFWGTGRDGRGQNMLGRLLMDIREELAFVPTLDELEIDLWTRQHT